MEVRLTACAPFELRSVVMSHGWVQLPPFAYDEATGALAYITVLGSGRTVELRVSPGEGDVRISAEDNLAESDAVEIRRQVTWMLDLDRNLRPFYDLVRDEPKLAQAEGRAQGRILRCATCFEDTIKTMLTTNTSWAGTIRMVSALVALWGAQVPGSPDRHAFPTPAQLALLSESDLRGAGLGYRAPYVLELAQAVASGALDLEQYRTSRDDTPSVRKQLLAIKGVGSYAAASLLMLLGRHDFVPVDSWAKRLVSLAWHDGKPIEDAEVEAAFEPWGSWKGLAYWFWDWQDVLP